MHSQIHTGIHGTQNLACVNHYSTDGFYTLEFPCHWRYEVEVSLSHLCHIKQTKIFTCFFLKNCVRTLFS